MHLYQQAYQGALTEEHPFGRDPLLGRELEMRERDARFFQAFAIENIFSECVNERQQKLQDAILFYINTTRALAQYIPFN